MPNRPDKTIIFCCNSLWGLLNFRSRVIQALARDGHRVVLVAHPDVPEDPVRDLGAEFVAWRLRPRSVNPFRELTAVLALRRIYRQIQPDLAFHFTIKAVLYGAAVARWSNVPHVSVITGLGYLFLRSSGRARLAAGMYRLALRRSQEVWLLNDEDRMRLSRAGSLEGLRVRTLPGEGIDLGHFAMTTMVCPAGIFVFLMIARLVKDKGVMEFVEAARQVRERHPHAVFRLLGPAYTEDASSIPLQQIQFWVREGCIEYLGAVDDVRPAIRDSHCVVLPSYREGMPRVLMEAAAMGRPAIATDVAGCRDVVVDGQTGLLCRPRDSTDLARACMDLIERPRAELESMALSARRRAAEVFDDQAVLAIYLEAISANSGLAVD